jgi:tetratricopeptide (TPR) repeat protein
VTTVDGPGSSFQQIVTAENGGFAYGVSGDYAEIHIFANGLPLYLLWNWQRQPDADPAWLRDMPSRMLNARRAVVPFTGRENELNNLRQWRDSAPQLAVRWLHGPGGQGKTRLAAQFANESATAGWKVVAAFHGPDADRPEPGSQDMSLTGATGLLLIVDYADRWNLTNLTWLFKNRLLHRPDVPTRVLMVARTADAWPAIQHLLDTYQASTSSRPLPDLPPETHERANMFTTARDSFTAIYHLPDPATLTPPEQLNGPEFGLILAVHMAALVAVDAAVHGRRPPADMAGLTMYLLNREQAHWQRLHEHGATAVGHAYLTPREVMNQAVFTAALTGSLSRPAGTAVLDRVHVGPDPDQILTDHAICYPPTDPTRSTVLEPLYPDRLAEDFLALTLPGHSAEYPTQPWAPDTTTTLIIRNDDGTPPRYVARALTFLAAAAAPDRWTHVSAYLNTILTNDPALAIEAGGPALSALAEAVDIGALNAINPLLPADRDVNLDMGAAKITIRLTDHKLTQTTDPAGRAQIYAIRTRRLANAGLRNDALAAAEEAVAINRQLAEEDPDTQRPYLAASLTNLGIQLAAMGRHQDALDVTQEAATTWRRLVAADPTLEPEHAATLTNLGSWLSNVGQHQQARDVVQEAVEIWRRLATESPAVHEHALATALRGLGGHLLNLGQRQEALATTNESIEIWRRLSQINPVAFEPDLVNALDSLVLILGATESWRDMLTSMADEDFWKPSLAASEEALQIRRRLVAANPAVFEPGLATTLNNLSVCYTELRRHDDAVRAIDEALTIRKRLAVLDPGPQESPLAELLANLGQVWEDMGYHYAAVHVVEQAVLMLQRLAATNPAAYEPALAKTLGWLEQHTGPGYKPPSKETKRPDLPLADEVESATNQARVRQFKQELAAEYKRQRSPGLPSRETPRRLLRHLTDRAGQAFNRLWR